MAGIGFELRKIFDEKSLFSVAKIYTYSAILSSGPWIISIITILITGIIKMKYYGTSLSITQFQVSITYIMMMSLIFSSPFHLSISRYISDRIFEQNYREIFPAFTGAVFITFITTLISGIIFGYFFLRNLTVLFNIIFITSFVILSAIWIGNVILLGLKEYKKIVIFYLIAYLIMAVSILFLARKDIELLLASFMISNIFLFFAITYLIAKKYRSDELINFNFLTSRENRINIYLVLSSFFYNTGIWADKIIFWMNDKTGTDIIGRLRASVVYDLPIFLAYLSAIPAMALFFYRLEADFAIIYENLFNSIREDGTMKEIKTYKSNLVESVKLMIREIIIIQGIFNIIISFFIPDIFSFLKIPLLYFPLFQIDLIGVQMQIGFMAMLSVIYYMDKKKESVYLSFFFLISNILLSYITVNYLGPYYFGYGFSISSLLSFIFSLIVLRKNIEELEYETFMFN